MSHMLYTAAMPFKRKGTASIKEIEFIMALSMDLSWFEPETAKAFIQKAIEEGIISREMGFIKARFEFNEVQIPMGFKPSASAFEEKEVFEQIISRIMAETGDEKQKIIAEINKKRDETGGLFIIDVLGILAAKERGIEVDDLIEKAYRNLLKQ